MDCSCYKFYRFIVLSWPTGTTFYFLASCVQATLVTFRRPQHSKQTLSNSAILSGCDLVDLGRDRFAPEAPRTMASLLEDVPNWSVVVITAIAGLCVVAFLKAITPKTPKPFLDANDTNKRQRVVLVQKEALSHDVMRFRFKLPAANVPFGLPRGKHIRVFGALVFVVVVVVAWCPRHRRRRRRRCCCFDQKCNGLAPSGLTSNCFSLL
jgi:hypothetical protein